MLTTTELSAEKARLATISQKLQNRIATLKLAKSWVAYEETKVQLEEVNSKLREARCELTARVQERINEQKEYEPPVTKSELCRRILSIVENLRKDIRSSTNVAEKHYKGEVLKQLEAIWGQNAAQ